MTHHVLLCDLDGTLIDGDKDLQTALGDVLEASGRRRPSLDEVRRMIGDGAIKLIERGFAATGAELDPEEMPGKLALFLERYDATEMKDTEVIAHVFPELRKLHSDGWQIGLCTNKPSKPADFILRKFGIRDIFSGIAGGDSYPVKKPHGDHITLLLKDMGIRKNEQGQWISDSSGEDCHVFMLGDNKNDVLSAQGAGVTSLLYTQSVGAPKARAENPDHQFSTYANFASALTRIAR
ncbi:HAD hydrolase-like protein [Kiloniella sp. b19]|uniref:HAD hydrolase-like protein n=1 Tax=Kiloniella sp. GXU_MW_B19 TaxID=3141326 RepID=UPI0031CE55B2